VKNTGKLAGDEVVQLYVSDVEASVAVPKLHLESFERIHLRPGEKKRVTFTLTPEHLAAYDDNGKPFVEPGAFEIAVGGCQPTDPSFCGLKTTLTVT
jgi:beta-glucosidase